MEEKRISVKEFDDAVVKVMESMVEDEKITGMAKLMIPLTGGMFASKMKKILFENNEEEK